MYNITCMFCGQLFSSILKLNSHVKIFHKALMNTQIQCNIGACTRAYHRFQSLVRHITSAHADIIKKEVRKNVKNNKKELILLENEKHECNSNNMHDSDFKSLDKLIESKNEISIEDFKDDVMHFATKFIAKLYSENNTDRKTIHDIISSINTFFFSICLNQLQSEYRHLTDVCEKIEVIKNCFQVFKTEHMTLKFFKNNYFLIMPQKILISSSLSLRKCKQTTQLLTRKTNIITIPLNLVLKKFLEMPHVFDKIISFIKNCSNCSVIKSIVQGTIWNSEEINDKNIKIPLTLFFDDVKVNNPLGSHKDINKIGTVYCTISCLPPEYASMLENIFLLQIHKYTDHKCFGNKRIFYNIIKQITDLENNALIINVSGKEYKIFFRLVYIAGDNLGLNSILGFNKSFNSMYSCRMCTIPKTEFNKQFVENP